MRHTSTNTVTSLAHPPAHRGWAGSRSRVEKPFLVPLRSEVAPGARIAAALSRGLESGAALVLLLLALPILAALALLVLLVDGRPVLYRGERLGQHKRPFFMYKVRTLRREAAQHTADRLLDSADRLEIRGGRFLRDSRLDELPQLWNIVRGEMSFVGPRPEREQVYRLRCRDIPGYARRFAVRPGMLGPSQLFTPHATHKRIRTWLDNTWCRRERSLAELVALTTFTAFVAGRKVVERTLESFRNDVLRARILRCYGEKRLLRRVRPAGAMALLVPDVDPEKRVHGLLLDLNEEALLVRSPRPLRIGTPARLEMAIEIAEGPHGPRFRHAGGTCVVRQQRPVDGGHELVLEYRPASARSHYVIHQYFLRNAFASPRGRSRQPNAWRRRMAASVVARVCSAAARTPRSPARELVLLPAPIARQTARSFTASLGSAEARR